MVQSSWENVFRAATMVSWHHQNYFVVGDTALLEVLIELKCVETVAVVEPKLRRAENDINVVFVVEG
jgi:hypothetical protein